MSNYKKAILTPNAAEFNRLFNSVTSQNVDIEDTNTDESIVKDIALRMGGVTIVRKGREDVISNGTESKCICCCGALLSSIRVDSYRNWIHLPISEVLSVLGHISMFVMLLPGCDVLLMRVVQL